MAKKKQEETKCLRCLYYKDGECAHESNIGIAIKRYRKKEQVYVLSAKDLEKSCKNFKGNDI